MKHIITCGTHVHANLSQINYFSLAVTNRFNRNITEPHTCPESYTTDKEPYIDPTAATVREAITKHSYSSMTKKKKKM